MRNAQTTRKSEPRFRRAVRAFLEPTKRFSQNRIIKTVVQLGHRSTMFEAPCCSMIACMTSLGPLDPGMHPDSAKNMAMHRCRHSVCGRPHWRRSQRTAVVRVQSAQPLKTQIVLFNPIFIFKIITRLWCPTLMFFVVSRFC